MSARPYVICHMVATIDGKILTERWKDLPVAKGVSELYESTAAEYGIGSWLVGTTTMKHFGEVGKSLPEPKNKVPSGDFIARTDAETHAIGTDTNGTLRFKDNEVSGDHIIIITTEKANDSYLDHLRSAGISYLICGRESIDLKLAMEKLYKEFKLKKVLLEGGGVLNGAMLQAGLIDEISQIIVPIVDGGGPSVTGLYEGDVRTAGRKSRKAAFSLRLIAQETRKHGAQWLRYRVRHV